MVEPDDSAEARAHALITRILGLVHECRTMLPELASPPGVETPSAQAERLLYIALLGVLADGLVRTVDEALAMLRQASKAARTDGRGVAGEAGAGAQAAAFGKRSLTPGADLTDNHNVNYSGR